MIPFSINLVLSLLTLSMTTTRSNQVERLEEAVSAIQNQQTEFSTKLDTVLTKLSSMDTTNNSSSSGDSGNNRSSVWSSLQSKPHLKLDIPRLDGSDTMGWVFKINLFYYHDTPESDRVRIASFYLDGPVLSWYQWMFNNGQIHSWQGFLQALEQHFAPSLYEDPKGALFKLVQKGSVSSYLTEFESLANRIVGLPQPFLLSCFISGLSADSRRDVQALQPLSFSQAAALAKRRSYWMLKDLLVLVFLHHHPFRPTPLLRLLHCFPHHP